MYSVVCCKAATPITLVLTFFFAVGATGSWMNLLQLIHRSQFGTTDPVFGRDIGWYVFVLPISDSAQHAPIAGHPHTDRRDRDLCSERKDLASTQADDADTASGSAHRWIACDIFRSHGSPDMARVEFPAPLFHDGPACRRELYRPAREISGPARNRCGGSVGNCSRDLRNVAAQDVFFTVVAAVIYVVVSIVAGGIFPYAMQRFVVAPTELTRELPQLRNHIKATRSRLGAGWSRVARANRRRRSRLADVRANSATIQNVRLWDRAPLLQTFGQLQEIRTYYDFISVDDDRYIINGWLPPGLLSPRELNAESLPKATFINQHLTFTHGMGLTLGPVNEVTTEGLPVLFIKNLPPVSTVSLKVTRPQIYFGELTNDHVFVEHPPNGIRLSVG